MVRSMYSGVAGMKAHQTRMDVIGNNISNVNTFGFKGSRATFRDIYYQTMKGASAASGSAGGINPAQVGYGANLGSIDVMQTQSSLSSTGNPMDMAISGDGFIQVMDGDGNKFYTRAGMLDIDAAGNLTDVNGNFVLGTNGKPVGQAPGSSKIQFAIPALEPKAASKTEEINGKKVTLSTTETTNEGNVGFSLIPGNLPIGQDAKAVVESNSVVVTLNSAKKFKTLEEVNTAIQDAIKDAYGKEHPAGTFAFAAEPAFTFPKEGLTGAQVVSASSDPERGKVFVTKELAGVGISVDMNSIGSGFNGSGATTYAITPVPNATAPTSYTVTATMTGGTYTGSITLDELGDSGKGLLLKPTGGSNLDSFVLKLPGKAGMADAAKLTTGLTTTELAIASKPSQNLGLGAKPFKLEGGTKGGPQSVKDLSSIQIGGDGVITAQHAGKKLEIGRIDLVVFENPKGLVQSGSTYFTESPNSGKATAAITGSSNAGSLAQSALELSNVDLSQEFSDMIVTQRGFQANSRLITVSDSMLEELINLKR